MSAPFHLYLCGRIAAEWWIYRKKQLQGIAIILVSLLFMIGFGREPFFDLDFEWSAVFTVIGIAGAVMTFLPDKKQITSG